MQRHPIIPRPAMYGTVSAVQRLPRPTLALTASFALGAALLGCSSQAKSGAAGESNAGESKAGSARQTPAAPTSTAMAPAAAEAKAREILQRQLDATKAHDDSIQKTFTADAVVFTHGKSTTADLVTHFGLADSGPDGVQTDKATIAKVLAGGNADAVWFYAEVATEMTGGDGKTTATTRVVEIASAAAQWRVVAASFGEAAELAGSGANREVENATAADGPLAKLLGAPAAVSAQLAQDAIVVGPANVARGAEAAAALASWKLEPLSVFQRAREVRTPTWGFVQANLDHPEGKRVQRIAATLVAIPAANGQWQVVLAQYAAQ